MARLLSPHFTRTPALLSLSVLVQAAAKYPQILVTRCIAALSILYRDIARSSSTIRRSLLRLLRLLFHPPRLLGLALCRIERKVCSGFLDKSKDPFRRLFATSRRGITRSSVEGKRSSPFSKEGKVLSLR